MVPLKTIREELRAIRQTRNLSSYRTGDLKIGRPTGRVSQKAIRADSCAIRQTQTWFAPVQVSGFATLRVVSFFCDALYITTLANISPTQDTLLSKRAAVYFL